MKIRSAISFVALLVCLGCFVLAANGRQRATVRPAAPRPDPAASKPKPRVLMIGDSLSVAPFGETLQGYFVAKYGPGNVAAYASCGSSPENWLADEPDFFTKCGYRQSTPDGPSMLVDFVNGKPPRRVRTPKLPTLVARHQPSLVVVQLGTNWMDRPLSQEQIRSFIDRFVAEAKLSGSRKMIWVAPPDSSALAKRQGRIHAIIQDAARRHGFEVIDSRRLTSYVPGKTGGDGVHYNKEASRAWARGVARAIDSRRL